VRVGHPAGEPDLVRELFPPRGIMSERLRQDLQRDAALPAGNVPACANAVTPSGNT
jgi:hypothetical protein